MTATHALKPSTIKDCHELIRTYGQEQERCIALGSPRAAQVYARAASRLKHYLLTHELKNLYSEDRVDTIRAYTHADEEAKRVFYTSRVHRIEDDEDSEAA